MQLQSLRPKRGLQLGQLRAFTEGRGWRATLPSAIPDALLLQLAHVFRRVEESLCRAPAAAIGGGDQELDLALYVVMNLLVQHPGTPGDRSGLTLSQQGLTQALQVYQWSLEREIVGRIVGQQPGDATASLLEGLQRCLQD